GPEVLGDDPDLVEEEDGAAGGCGQEDGILPEPAGGEQDEPGDGNRDRQRVHVPTEHAQRARVVLGEPPSLEPEEPGVDGEPDDPGGDGGWRPRADGAPDRLMPAEPQSGSPRR